MTTYILQISDIPTHSPDNLTKLRMNDFSRLGMNDFPNVMQG